MRDNTGGYPLDKFCAEHVVIYIDASDRANESAVLVCKNADRYVL